MSDAREDQVPSAQLSLFDAAAPDADPVPAGVPGSRPGDDGPAPDASPAASDPDATARAFAIDPRNNVVLEASAGTGKTSVLVWRYVNLLKAGVDPGNILAITFTRKAAAEMRERVVRELKTAAARSELDKARWHDIRGRLGEIAISTIDAFSLSLLREFPLEADLDPGFEMADETEVPRLVDAALDQALRIFARLAREDPDVALVLAQLGVSRTRAGLASLLHRRLVAWEALNRFLSSGPRDLSAGIICRRTATSLQDVLRTVPGGLPRFLADGPVAHPRYQLFARDLQRLAEVERAGDASIRALLDRVAAHFLTSDGNPRRGGGIPPYSTARDYPAADAARRHRAAVFQIAPQIERVVSAFSRDFNVVLARGIRRMFAIALEQYRQALDERSVLDFSDVLQRALDLLRRMDEFSQSRFRLESRYHHVLVDEFQDTSRAQWELVSLLIQSWGEGLGLATQPSIFIVGDRKQSIYRFRDAEAAVLQHAGRYIQGLRPAGDPRRAISRSFRALPELLQFVNELFADMSQPGGRPDDFTYGDTDRFPVDPVPDSVRGPVLGIAAAEEPAAVAAEIERILREETLRDRKTGVPRAARPGDIAILFRSRTSHREFEHELEVRGIPTYVYKGLGFFDADEIKDLSALIRYLANPVSDLRAAAFLRSRFVRISDVGLSRLGRGLAAALTGPRVPESAGALGDEDRRVLLFVRGRVAEWIARVDRVPPADLIEQILPETAYAYELRGPRRQQAWENLKKMRGLVRRIQNRGYATLARIADHMDSLSAGDESNAVIEALDAVNLMTVHASKGLEFPVVFVVNLSRGASGPPRPVRVVVEGEGGEPSVSVGPFVSETDEAEREREKHETRRLLYVALTRARDRLYFSSVLKDAVVVPGRGSLAEVLPDSVRELFSRAATSFVECAEIGWAGSSGRPFNWRICRVPDPLSPLVDASAAEVALPVEPARVPRPADQFGPPAVSLGTRRIPITRWLQTVDAEEPADAAHEAGREGPRNPVVGTLVHRLFQFHDGSAGMGEAVTAADVQELLHADERTGLVDADATVQAALDAYQRMRRRQDVHMLLASGQRQYEVPSSMRMPPDPQPAAVAATSPVILRGVIDCVIVCVDGSVVVLEFKTGRPRRSHERQLDTYVHAARSLFPEATVRGQLVYDTADAGSS
ncbi:MAG: UvrD-helicase domain-containing protein [Acidobacteriota bacterium]|nr:UvrD-helicase domain-containing protein [Acidobacteriota bacterium]